MPAFGPVTQDVAMFVEMGGARSLEQRLGRLPDGFGEILSGPEFVERFPAQRSIHVASGIVVPSSDGDINSRNHASWVPSTNEERVQGTPGMIVVSQDLPPIDDPATGAEGDRQLRHVLIGTVPFLSQRGVAADVRASGEQISLSDLVEAVLRAQERGLDDGAAAKLGHQQ